MSETLKKYYSIGCCGIDCGLCPRFYTRGDSVCPGCGGLNFSEKHPSCGILTCCAIKKGLDVCSFCSDYPCSRFDPVQNGYDSFVTHKKIFENLDEIKRNGIEYFIDRQSIRLKILRDFLANFDEGRSKSFFCVSCALLPLDKLIEIHRFITSSNNHALIEVKNRQLKDTLLMMAQNLKIDLKLKTKQKENLPKKVI